MRLGIFGGAFDPVHNGHLLVAEQCREQCGLDEVWFVPTRIPPHKDAADLSPDNDRLEMLNLATAGMSEFVVSRVELDRDETSWTVDTLERLQSGRPDDELFLLIGADSLRDFPTWREPQRIAELATLVVVNRGDVGSDSFVSDLAAESRSAVRQVSIPGVDFAATDIRSRIARGQSIRFMVPRSVEEYIRQHGLYR